MERKAPYGWRLGRKGKWEIDGNLSPDQARGDSSCWISAGGDVYVRAVSRKTPDRMTIGDRRILWTDGYQDFLIVNVSPTGIVLDVVEANTVLRYQASFAARHFGARPKHPMCRRCGNLEMSSSGDEYSCHSCRLIWKFEGDAAEFRKMKERRDQTCSEGG